MSRLRADMPTVADFVDGMRAAFGVDGINQQIRRGIAGEPTFHGAENGLEVGTRYVARGAEISLSRMYVERPRARK